MGEYIHTSNGKKQIPSPSEVLFKKIADVQEEVSKIEQDIERLENLKTSLISYGMCMLSDLTSITDSTGIALPATEKNPNINGSLASQIQTNKNNISNLQTNTTNNTNKITALEERMICLSNIKDVSEIFTYRRYELALFSNWNNSSLCPTNYCMILRIPQYDARLASCLCMRGSQLYIGDLHFDNKTLTWTEK